MKRSLALIAFVTCVTFAAFGQSNFRQTGAITASGQSVTAPIFGYGVANVTINGTYAGVTGVFEFSDDGGTTFYPQLCTRTDTATQELSEVIASNATESWDCGLHAGTHFRFRASAYGSGTANVAVNLSNGAAFDPALTVAIGNTAGSGDPCGNPTVAKSSVILNITTATTTSLVALSAGKIVYVCGFAVSMTGTTTADTIQFISGTGATCGTGTVNQTGVISSGILANGATVVSYGAGGSTAFKSNTGQGLCIVSTVATSPTIAGLVTFIQQ